MKTNLEGKDIGIRPFRSSDVVPFFQAAVESSSHVYEFLPWCHAGFTMEESRAWVVSRPESWECADEYSFAIYAKNGGEFLGGCGINQLNQCHNFGNIGYWVSARALHMGVATEAVVLLKEFGFGQLMLTRLEIVTAVHNLASRKVAEKSGATFEGILKKRLVLHGEAVDAAMYSLA